MPPPPAQSARLPPFRAVLVAVLLALVIGSLGVVVWLSHRSAQGTAQRLALQVLDQQAERVQGEIEAVLREASLQGQVTAKLLAAGVLPPDDCTQLVHALHEALVASPRLSYLSFGRETNGNYCHAVRGSKGNLSVRTVLRGADGHLTLTDYARENRALRQIDRQTGMDGRDPRPRPYYKAAQAAGKSVWTETYLFLAAREDLDVPGVTYATPVKSQDGSLLGVVSADFDLYALSSFLGKLALTDRAGSFVVELRHDGSRRVIAHPEPHWLTEPLASGGADFVPVERIKDERVRLVLDHFGSSSQELPARDDFEFTGEKRGRHFAQMRRIRNAEGLDWLLCLTVPADEILRDANQALQHQLLVALACALAAVLLGWLLSGAITRPLQALAAQARQIGQFELGEPAKSSSRVRELAELGRSFETMRAGLRSFRKYVPAELVRQLVQSGIEAKPGGHRDVLTIFFADIAGFTTVAESLAPEALTQWLGEYLDAMTTIVLQEDGTVDKYIGDAVMAFWGAPKPYGDHAYAACRTALLCQRKMAELQKVWSQRGLPPVACRIGVNTGAAMVGNVGSNERLEYTALGDAVNLASRLEGANKFYGTLILIGDTTRQIAANRIIARPVDKLSVKGKRDGVVVHELLALRFECDDTTRKLADVHAQAFERYLAGDFSTASELCDQVLALRPSDGPAEVLKMRCRSYLAHPPRGEWSGVFRADEK